MGGPMNDGVCENNLLDSGVQALSQAQGWLPSSWFYSWRHGCVGGLSGGQVGAS